MTSAKKKATAKPGVKFKDLKSKKDPKGGFQWGVGRGITSQAGPVLDKTSTVL